MRRYASHYLIHPSLGMLKQQVVEVEQGKIVGYFPLTEEMESVEWLPGVISLEADEEGGLFPVWMYPYDFTEWKPASGTQRRRLL